MKRVIWLLVLLLGFSNVHAQSAEGRYNSRLTQDGVLFFINPQKLKDLSGIKKFEYDVTMLSWTDSVTFNFTFVSSSMQIPDRLSIECDNNSMECRSFSPLYVDIKGQDYEVRITSKFSVAEMRSFISCQSSPVFIFYQGRDLRTAAYKESAWRKDRKKLGDIFQLFMLSR